MTTQAEVERLYVKSDTLTTRMDFHTKYSVNKYGFGNWTFDQYNFKDGMRILELGCGTAKIWHNRESRLPKDAKIILSDFSPLMVNKARELMQDNPAFSFQQINIEEIPYVDDSFDMVMANHVVHHVQDKPKALSEIRRVLKPGGSFYSTTMGKDTLKELTDIYQKLEGKASFVSPKDMPFTLEKGRDLLQQYFTNIEQRQYIDSLEITNADDLVEYVTSYNELCDAVICELRQLINEGFVNGVFKIQKTQGIFICVK